MYVNKKIYEQLKICISYAFTAKQISLSAYLNERMKSGKFLFKLEFGNLEAI